MSRATKPLLALAAAYLSFLFLAARAHAQSIRSAQLVGASSHQRTVQPGASRCAFETDIPLNPHRLTLAETRCEAPSPPAMVVARLCPPTNGLAANCEGGDPVGSELLKMGIRGEIIAHARERALQILQSDNACSAWFRELDLDPAATFRSTHFVIEEQGLRYVFALRLGGEGEIFKHPWTASTIENAGRNATIWLNANGAFFKDSLGVVEQEQNGGPLKPAGMRVLRVDWYPGNTLAAQVTALLHELGHIVGRIPEDNDTTDGQSGRNTAEVLRYCRPEVRAVAGKDHTGGGRRPAGRTLSNTDETKRWLPTLLDRTDPAQLKQAPPRDAVLCFFRWLGTGSTLGRVVLPFFIFSP